MIVMFFIAIPVICAEIDGTWRGIVDGMDGQKLEVTYGFKAEGEKLIGFLANRLDGVNIGVNISNGKVDGKNIEFRLNAGDVVIMNNGTISGDEIQMTQTIGTEKTKYVLKRVIFNPGTTSGTGATSGPGIITITKPE